MLEKGIIQAICTMFAAEITMLILKAPQSELVTCFAWEQEHANSILASNQMHRKALFRYSIGIPSEIVRATA